MNRLERLQARRLDPMIKEARLLNEAYAGLQQSESVRYALGAMQPIDPEYTKNTFAQGERVKEQLKNRLSQACEYRYQGSTTNDTHIRAKSDLDLLVVVGNWHWVEEPTVPQNPYKGDPKADLAQLRQESEKSVRDAFPKAEVDCSGGKCVTLEGGSLTRRIDVVPASWWNTNRYAATNNEVFRGVKVFDSKTGAFVPNLPFLHNWEIEQKDIRTGGGLRKAARLMKSLKYDATKVEMSSYDIASVAFNIPDIQLLYSVPFELRIVDSCHMYCTQLREDAKLRDSILVPNKTRRVFDPEHGATTAHLDQLLTELTQLRTDILHENARSFVKLAEARVEYPSRQSVLAVP